MKTALEELIEYVTKYEELIGITATMVKDKATNLLEKEREQICDAYDNGNFDGVAWNEKRNGNQYYSHIFKK